MSELTRENWVAAAAAAYGDGDHTKQFLAWDLGDPSGSYSVRPCIRCEGRGYHHGFGETGHDPDWCVKCGGNGWEFVSPPPPSPIEETPA